MSILSVKESKKIDIRYKIGSGATSISYRTKDNYILKKFIYNSLYRKIVESHNHKFAEYLEELSLLDDKFLVVPEDIYIMKNRLVASYTYEYQYGTTIEKMYPKTDLESLLNAIDEFCKYLENMEYLRLMDMHYRNIIFTGDIKLIDLDMCYFTNEKDVSRNNLIAINNGIFRGVFGLSPLGKIVILDEGLKSVYESMINGEIRVSDFLREYRDLVINEYGKCKYIKHLRKELVSEICESNRSK